MTEMRRRCNTTLSHEKHHPAPLFKDVPEDSGVTVTQQQITAYVEALRERGCVEGSLKKYRRDLETLFEYLPDGKQINRTTLWEWRAALIEQGYAPRTINASISEANGFLSWLGRREYQLSGTLALEHDIQPELSRTEYLRLLSAARTLGKERTYLMVKVFTTMGLTVRELPRLTVETVAEHRVAVTSNGTRQVVPIPGRLRDELMDYIRREGICSGPVFVTKNRRRMNRTAVTGAIQSLARDAQVMPEKCNPRCLRKLYQATMAGIEASVHLLVEQTHERLLEQEQLTIGWEQEQNL